MLTTYEEYMYLVEGKRADASQMWECVRWLGWYEEMLSPYVKPGRKHHSPQDIFLMEGEKKPVKGHLSGEMKKETVDALAAIYEDFYRDKPSN